MKWLVEHKFGVWGFLVAGAFIPTIMSAAVVGRWAVIAMGVPLAAPLRLKVPPFIQMAIAMGLAWAAASLFVTPDPMDGALQFFFMVVLVGAMGAASQVESLDDLMGGLCWGLALSSAFCLIAVSGHRLVAESGMDTGYAGLFYNREVLAEFAAPLLVWTVVKKRWFLAAAAAVPLVVNLSRISVASVIIALTVAYWPRSPRARAAVVILAVALVGAAVAYYSGQSGKVGTALLRLAIWLQAAMSITPLGNGLGWYRVVTAPFEFAHSDVLQAFAELGIGALCFAVIPIYALRNRGDHAERAAFIVICIELVVSFPLHVPGAAFLAAVLAGFLVRDRAAVRRVQLDGGIQAGENSERFSEVWSADSGRGGRGDFLFPVRRSVETVSGLDQARGCVS